MIFRLKRYNRSNKVCDRQYLATDSRRVTNRPPKRWLSLPALKKA
jgi:hypothetical protein